MKHEHTQTPAHRGENKSGWVSTESLNRLQDQVVDTAKDAYVALVDASSDALSKANRRASTMIRQYPVQAAAGALAIGFLAGAFISRRRKA